MTKTYKKAAAVACGVLMLAGFAGALGSPSHIVYAADDTAQSQCKGGAASPGDKPCIPTDLKDNNVDPAEAGTCSNSKKGLSCLLEAYVNPFLSVLSGLVGIVAAISLVYAGIQYASSAGDPSKVQAAKQRILKTVFGLLAYLFMFAFLQWLVPGGIF